MGKYHRSPSSRSSMAHPPSTSSTVIRHDPYCQHTSFGELTLMMYAHSLSLCQCSSLSSERFHLEIMANADIPIDTWAQAHIDSSQLSGGRKLSHSSLSRPSTFFQTHMRVGEGPDMVNFTSDIALRLQRRNRLSSLDVEPTISYLASSHYQSLVDR